MELSYKIEKQVDEETKEKVFEGPLDLLLHLIEKNKVDIYDIPIAEITEQYLAYMDTMEQRDMNTMSEFMVMAATLIDIKCRMMLPREVNEEGEEEDPREDLIRKILEYKMYKYMSYELKDRLVDGGRSVVKGPSMPDEILSYREPVDYDKLMGDMNLAKLGAVYQDMLKRVEDRVDPVRSKFGTITDEGVSVERKAEDILNFLNAHEICTFRELVGEVHHKMDIVVSFLVVLELMKMGQITIQQDELFDDIRILRAEDASSVTLGEDFSIL